MTEKRPSSLQLIYCYAREDQSLRNRLDVQLTPLKRAGYIISWYDEQIKPGTIWQEDIATHLQQADIILLLVSPDFIASDYCFGIEMQEAIARHLAGEAKVVPILLRPTRWEDTPLNTLQVLPTNARPITRWTDIDEALDVVYNDIRKIIIEMLAKQTISDAQLQVTRESHAEFEKPFITRRKSLLNGTVRMPVALIVLTIVLVLGISRALFLLALPQVANSHLSSPISPLVNSAAPVFMFGSNAQHTRVIPREQVLNSSNVSGLVQAWIARTGGSIVSSPIVANGVVYIGSEDRKLYAYAATGCGVDEVDKECIPLWTTEPTEGIIDSSPAIFDGKVYIGSMDGRLYVYNATGCRKPSCSPLWTSQSIGEGDPDQLAFYASPAIADGIVYISSHDGRLYAYNAEGCGQKECPFLWRSDQTGNWINSSPAVANGVVYVGSYDSRLYAYNAAGCGQTNCPPLWSGLLGDFISSSSPTVADNMVFVGSYDRKLYAFNAAGCGNVITSCPPLFVSAPTGDRIDSSPAVANGVVYIGSGDKKLYAYDINICKDKQSQSCPPLWISAPTGGPISSSPTIANGVVYVGSLDGRLYAYNAKGCGNQKFSCPPLWHSQVLGTGGIFSSPTIANGMVYIASKNGNLYAFHLTT